MVPNQKESGGSSPDDKRLIGSIAADIAINEAVLGMDRSGAIVYVNDCAKRSFGLSEDRLLSMNIAELHGSDKMPFDWPAIVKAVREHGRYVVSGTHQHANGSVFPVETIFRPARVQNRDLIIAVARDVSARNGLQESLKVARERAMSYFELADLLFLVLDPEGEIMDINQTGCRLLECDDKDKAIGKNWFAEFVPPEQVSKHQEIFEGIKQEKPEYALAESLVRTKGGRTLTVSWHNSVLRNDDNELVAVLAAGVNVTERRRNEIAARRRGEVSQRLASLTAEYMASGDFDHLMQEVVRHVGSAVAADRAGLGQVNDGQEKVFYRHEWQAEGLEPLLVNLDDMPTEQLSISAEYVRAGQPWIVDDVAQLEETDSLDIRLLKEHGVKSVLLVPLPTTGAPIGVLLFTRERQAQPWQDDQLDLVKFVASIVANAVARHRSETKRQEIESRLNDVINSVPIGVYRNTPGPEGHFLEVNRAIVEMFEADSREEILKHRVSDLYVNPDERRSFSEKMVSQGAVFNEQLRLKTLKGREFWASVTAVRKDDGNGEPYFDGVIEDITERVEAEERVKDLDDLKNTFIQVVSHQVRTPLNSIRWSLETLMSEELGKLTDSQKDFMRVVYSAETEVLARLDDMLTALDIEEGRVVVRRSRFALNSLLNTVLARAKRRCKLKEIALEYEVPEESLEAMVDGDKVRSAMAALVNNAVDYTDNGGKIAVRLEKDDSRFRFRVTDSGIGIPQAEHDRIFNRFYRASNAAVMNPDANGLSLAIAKYYVEQHGGNIGFSSKEGEGSIFWFELPIG